MKNIFSLFLLAGALVLGACGGDDTQQEANGDMAERPAAGEPAQHMAAEAVRRELSQVYDEYLDVKDALVKSDAEAAKANAGELLNELAFDASTLTTEERAEWDMQMQAMKTAATDIATGDLARQREAFADLSTAMEAVVRNLGLHGKTVYKQYCPMAFNDQGGYWLAGEQPLLRR